jgi:DNA adenine methylase
VAKLSDTALDIRKPYTEIGGAGIYSGRHFDETFVAPFAFKHGLPVNPTTSFLTPAFRTNKTVIAPGGQLIGRPKKLYADVVDLITSVHSGAIKAADLLAEIIRWLLIIRAERKQRIETLFASLKGSANDSCCQPKALSR